MQQNLHHRAILICTLFLFALLGTTTTTFAQSHNNRKEWTPWVSIGHGLEFSWTRVAKEGKNGDYICTWAVKNTNAERAEGSLIITAYKANGEEVIVKGFEPIFICGPNGGTMGGWAAYTVVCRDIRLVHINDMRIGKTLVVEDPKEKERRLENEAREEKRKADEAARELRREEEKRLAAEKRRQEEAEQARRDAEKRREEQAKADEARRKAEQDRLQRAANTAKGYAQSTSSTRSNNSGYNSNTGYYPNTHQTNTSSGQSVNHTNGTSTGTVPTPPKQPVYSTQPPRNTPIQYNGGTTGNNTNQNGTNHNGMNYYGTTTGTTGGVTNQNTPAQHPIPTQPSRPTPTVTPTHPVTTQPVRPTPTPVTTPTPVPTRMPNHTPNTSSSSGSSTTGSTRSSTSGSSSSGSSSSSSSTPRTSTGSTSSSSSSSSSSGSTKKK